MGEYIISKITKRNVHNEKIQEKSQEKKNILKKNLQKSTFRKIYDTFIPGDYDPYKEERRYKKTSNSTWKKSTPIRFRRNNNSY